MTLAQAVNSGTTTGTQSIAGIDGSQIFWGVLIVAAIIIAFMFLSSYNRGRYHGTKGGRVKRVTEYEDEDDDLV